MQRVAKTTATATIANKKIGATPRPARATIATRAARAMGALLRRKARSDGWLTSTKSISSARREISAAAPSISNVSPTRTTISSRPRPMFWLRRCTAKGYTPKRRRSRIAPSERPTILHPGVINTSTVLVSTELSLSTVATSLLAWMPSNSDISVRNTTRSPASRLTDGKLRRKDKSPRRTSTRRTPSRLNISTFTTCCPINPDPSGSATSVKNFILLRPPRRPAMLSRSGSSIGAITPRYTIPHATKMIPRGVISKIVKGASPSARATPSTSRFVDVPINVSVPPITAA